MKYHLYDENYNHKGDFQNLQEMRNYLCEWKWLNNLTSKEIEGIVKEAINLDKQYG